jgi:hypothetical protein
MNRWLGIALIAYSIGAIIEGASAANALVQSFPEPPENGDSSTSTSGQPFIAQWRVLTAIVTVSLCGAVSWPCRLMHRSLKECQNSHNEHP